MKKVLQIITLSETGGAQNVVYDIVRSLNQDFYFYVACAPGGELVQKLKSIENVEVIEIPDMKRNISPIYDMKVLIKLIRIIKQKQIDIIHCHSSKAGILGRFAAFLCRVPKRIFTVHGWGINQYQTFFARNFYRLMEFLAGLISTDIVCVSHYDESNGLKYKIITKRKTKVVYNGIEEPSFEKGKLREELGLKEKELLIGTVARIAEQKNPIFTAEVVKKIVRVMPHVKFVWIGTGELKEQLKLFIRENSLEKNFILLGNRQDAKGLLKDLDLFVLLSKWEGLPISIIEAMFAQCAIIASNVGGVGELISHQYDGELVYELDLKEAAEKILGLLEDEETRKAYGRNARNRALAMLNLSQMVGRYKEIYEYQVLR